MAFCADSSFMHIIDMKTTKLALSTFLFLSSLSVMAAGESRRFWVTAPDTMEIGKPAKIVYHLHTNEFSDVLYPRLTDFNVQSYKYPPFGSYYNKSRYRDFEWVIDVVPYRCGSQQIATMSVVIDGETISSEKRTVFVSGRATANGQQILKALNQYWASHKVFNPDYQTFKGNSLVEHEISEAKKWLAEKGQKSDDILLKLVGGNGDVSILSDEWNSCFAVVANKKYQTVLGNPVLAYSLESSAEKHEELLKNYAESLKQMLKANDTEQANGHSHQWQHDAVPPLLGSTRWGQDAPYNAAMPNNGNGDKMILGPAAVACGQLMHYHKYPTKAVGHRIYTTTTGEIIDKDLSELSFDWTQTEDECSDSSVLSPSMANLLAANAYALGTESMGGSQTMCTNMSNFKSVLVNNFKYSVTCCFLKDVTASAAVSLLYKELDEQRSVLCEGLSTYFVCDGYDGEFFHVNMGWKGYFNGYYRFILPNVQEDSPIVNSMLVGIKPDDGKTLRKDVVLREPGILSKVLSEEEKREVTSLKISGKLDGKDMMLIRRMAGAIDMNDKYLSTGKLTDLDLYDAVFLTDKKQPYMQKDASGYSYHEYHTTTYYGITFDHSSRNVQLGDVSNNEWESLRNNKLFKGKGYEFKKGDGENLHVEFTLKKGVVTPFLFADCENLRNLVLPKKTTSIEDVAFKDCNSLVDLNLPPSVKEVTEGCFMSCYQLGQVNISKRPNVKKAQHGVLQLTTSERKKRIDYGPFIGNNKDMCKGFKVINKK